MKRSNKAFVLTGCILIAVILAYKFGMFDRIGTSRSAPSQETTAERFSSSASGLSKQEMGSNAVPAPLSAAKASAEQDLAKEDKNKGTTDSAPVQSIADSQAPLSAASVPDMDVPGSLKKELPVPGTGDPFSYAAQNADDNYPMSGGEKKIGSISVKGIIRLKGSAPVAILHLKDTGRNYYVSRGDVIRITENSGKSNAPLTEAYVVIKDVRDEEVELVQQERPDKVIIIR